jgi:hypothetical protein
MLPACRSDATSSEASNAVAPGLSSDVAEETPPELGFAHLRSRDGGFDSTHGLRYRFEATDALAPVGPLHRTDRFDGNPYEISLAAFVSSESAIMLHVERVADGSGASDYDALAPAGWPDQRFRSEGPNCVDVAIAERDEEHDLRWLQANGFDPVGQLVVQQFFATTPDHNDEIVVTLMRLVADCDETAAHSGTAAVLDDLRSVVTIAPL